jgi:hypothetical protein
LDLLIIGVHWGTTSANQLRVGYDPTIPRDGFPLSPWITGALVSLYIFGAWTGEIRRETLMLLAHYLGIDCNHA